MPRQDDVFAAALSLPESDRAKLANQLLESLPPPEPKANEAWSAEIERRAREVLDGTVDLLDYDEVMAELRTLDGK
ncbi:MAG: addiction module protein [Proteobacteria bacterium]|nr:addiction module protein [Pseudomonadota bacterium]